MLVGREGVSQLTATKPICDQCHELIGVYEPVVVVSGVEAREISRPAEPAIGSQSGECYHRACYFERFDPARGALGA